MRGYPYEIRRYPLMRALESNRLGVVVDRGVIDRATPETHQAVVRALERAAAEHATGGHLPRSAAAGSPPTHRFAVLWLRTPRGQHASLFRGMFLDKGTA
jgi:hypothetical protein